MSNSPKVENSAQCNCTYVPSSGTAELGIISGTPITNGPNANFLADSLGVSPLYRQQDTARWQSAAQVYHSSRAHSPVGGTRFTFPELPDTGPRTLRQRSQPNVGDILRPAYAAISQTMEFKSHTSVSSPISLEDIANMNRRRHAESGGIKTAEDMLHGPLELEAISAVHELSYSVKSIYVSEILPRTADLIFVNVKTVEDHPYTLELTMKGWRIASTHTDCMNGDYTQVELHTRYFKNAKELLEIISPGHAGHFNTCLTERLRQLESGKTEEVGY